MKKLMIVLILAATVSASFALSNKYQIFSERKGWFGLGGKTIIMLDRESGDSWRYESDKWVVIPKITIEASALETAAASTTLEDEATKRAKIEAELTLLRAKQEADIKTLQARQAEEMKMLVNNLSSSKKEVSDVRPALGALKKRPKAAAPVKAQAEPARDDGVEEGPPAWLSE
jgi:hypothetical protein